MRIYSPHVMLATPCDSAAKSLQEPLSTHCMPCRSVDNSLGIPYAKPLHVHSQGPWQLWVFIILVADVTPYYSTQYGIQPLTESRAM